MGRGSAPGAAIDPDSSIAEVHGQGKRGARYGRTRALGYHPIFATSAMTGEVIHARLRHGEDRPRDVELSQHLGVGDARREVQRAWVPLSE